MPSVRELSALYENVMLGPRRGPSVCVTCFNFTDGYSRCYACDHGRSVLDAVAPISYSVGREQLHHALASYKRLDGEVARRLCASLAAILWRFLAEHERCVARAVNADHFNLVTTVPSSDRRRDEQHPLNWIVGELVGPTRDRHERLLERSQQDVAPRTFSPDKFAATRPLRGAAVLLIDDTWTTGGHAQSAVLALRKAGAARVSVLVVARWLKEDYGGNKTFIAELTTVTMTRGICPWTGAACP